MQKILNILSLLVLVGVLLACLVSCSESPEAIKVKERMVEYASTGKDYTQRWKFFSPAYVEEQKSKGAGWDITTWNKTQWDTAYGLMTKVHQKLMEPGVSLAPTDCKVRVWGKFAEADVGTKYPELKGIPVYWVKDGDQWYLFFNTPQEQSKYGTP